MYSDCNKGHSTTAMKIDEEEKRRECRVINLLNFTTSTKSRERMIITGKKKVDASASALCKRTRPYTGTAASMGMTRSIFKKSVLDLTTYSDFTPTHHEFLLTMSQAKREKHLNQWSDISDRYVALTDIDSFDNDFWISPQKEMFPMRFN